MAHAVHQLSEVRARLGRELVAGVPQVMKMNTGQADRGSSRHPGATVEIAVTERGALGASEDEDRRRT